MKINPKISMNFDKNKDTKIKLFQQYLFKNISTIAMASKATGIPERKIEIYLHILQEQGLIFTVFIGLCKQTGLKSNYLTTNIKLKNKRIKELLVLNINDFYGL